jgi:hypothetical protein
LNPAWTGVPQALTTGQELNTVHGPFHLLTTAAEHSSLAWILDSLLIYAGLTCMSTL